MTNGAVFSAGDVSIFLLGLISCETFERALLGCEMHRIAMRGSRVYRRASISYVSVSGPVSIIVNGVVGSVFLFQYI